jgi:hypothetical protein
LSVLFDFSSGYICTHWIGDRAVANEVTAVSLLCLCLS